MTDRPPRPSIRVQARRTYSYNSERRRGRMFWSRINRQNFYVGWEAEAGVKASGITLEMPADEAKDLRDWLISQIPLEDGDITCTVCSKPMQTICTRCA